MRPMLACLIPILLGPASIVPAQAQGPELTISQTTVAFELPFAAGASLDQPVRIGNAGHGQLVGITHTIRYAPGQPTNWLQATLSTDRAPATLSLRAIASPDLPPGGYTATVVVMARNAKRSPQTIAVAFTVMGEPAETATELASSPNPSLPGQSVTFTVRVSGTNGGRKPTGRVILSGITPNMITLDDQGNGTLTVPGFAAEGLVIVDACYDGDLFFTPSCAPTLHHSVERLATVVNLTSSLNPSTVGDAVTFTATVTGPTGAGTPTGSVSLLGPDDADFGAAQLGANGSADFTVSSGSTTDLRACYSGDATFLPQCSEPLTQTVNPYPTTIAATTSPNPSAPFAVFTLIATVTGPGTPTGIVRFSFENGFEMASPAALDADGVASSTENVVFQDEGPITINVCYDGDGTFGASCTQITHTVQKIPSTIVLTSSPNPAAPGEPVTFAATVTGPADAGTPAGSVRLAYTFDNNAVGFEPLGADGVAHIIVSTLAEGDTPLRACYNGSFGDSCSNVVVQSITRAVADIALNPDVVTVSATPGGAVSLPPIQITSNGVVRNLALGPVTDGGAPISWVFGTLSNNRITPSTLMVTASPPPGTTLGNHVLTIPVRGDGAPNSTPALTVNLNVASPGSALALAPDARDFGLALVGGFVPAVRVLTITNTGGTPFSMLNITTAGTNRTEFVFTVGSTCFDLSASNPLRPGASCDVALSFHPQATGLRSASLAVSAGSFAAVPAALSGTGVLTLQSPLAFLPTSSDFGLVPFVAGAESAPQTVTLTNTGDDPAVLTLIPAGQYPGDFPIAPGSSCYQHVLASAPLDAGMSCDLVVTFVPHGIGPRTAQLAASTTGHTNIFAAFTGTGTQASATTLVLSPSAQDFGSVIAWPTEKSGVETFTVTNSGAASAVLSITRSGPNADDFSLDAASSCAGHLTVTSPLPVGASCELNLTFAPKLAGPRGATLTVGAQGDTPPVSAALSGNGLQPAATTLSINPPAFTFGSVKVWPGEQSAPHTFTLTNTGNEPAVLTITQVGSVPAEFVAGAGSTCLDHTALSSPLAVGGQCQLIYVFTPNDLGFRASPVTIGAQGETPLVSINLNGTGVAQEGTTLAITPTAHDFGSAIVDQGANSSPTVFTVTNTGTIPAALTIDVTPLPQEYFSAGSPTCYAYETPATALPAGASCTLAFVYIPKIIGTRSEILSVDAQASTPAATATLTGTGLAPAATSSLREIVDFSPADATRDVLGTARLTDEQRKYLDRNGNHNGVYDLGDLIAFLDRNHIPLSPALLGTRAMGKERVQ